MKLIIKNLKISMEKDGPGEYIKAAAERLKINPVGITLVKILSKSLDMSDKNRFCFDVSIVVQLADDHQDSQNLPVYTEKPIEKPARLTVGSKTRPVIVGFGPAGMFAALELIERGVKPVILERGKALEEREKDVKNFMENRVLNPESNIQFGEGGAGAYSDGKLFSRKNDNSPEVSKVLETFIRFGAPEEISYMEKPHLGTDVLCAIVKNIRGHIIKNGGEIYYSSKVTGLITKGGRVSGVTVNNEKEFLSDTVFLAIGHSSRDTFEMLLRNSMVMEQRPIAVGVRIEHPAALINRLRYGDKYAENKKLGAAFYSFTHKDNASGRNVCSFCMCPGGEIINASSEPGGLVVNGMSYSKRASEFSCSAIVVSCRPEDYGAPHPLAGIEFQKAIEKKAFELAGGDWRVPGQNLMDFLASRQSGRLNKNSCKTGSVPVELKQILPEFVSNSLISAFNKWKEAYPTFVSEQAVLLAPETRTSCPVKIKRKESYDSEMVKGLYPIGEGSGYSGGIVSSAADAVKAVNTIIDRAQ